MKKSKKYQAVNSLAEALKKPEKTADNVSDIIKALENEPDKKKRKKMMKDFAARSRETADFLSENEAEINAGVEAALIRAAVSGNVNALRFYLKNRMPDKYSDKPKETVEIEDISEVEEMIYGNKAAAGNDGEKDDTV